ncbi:MAG: hypothetical protein OXH00_26120 [Candidatus Poribacteria bacterium]|nr:hypothetical protein [Candidatus Poribacteria bacterium]
MQSRAGKQASVDGFANEHIAAAILMKRYHHVSLMDVPLSSYDLLIDLRNTGEHEDIIRAQVKTARTSIPFTGGGRGGVDREYKSGVKTYTYSTETSDVVIGIHPIDENDSAFELYFIPTILIEKLGQKSIAISKIEPLKENYFILENCKNEEIVIEKGREYGILPSRTQQVLDI